MKFNTKIAVMYLAALAIIIAAVVSNLESIRDRDYAENPVRIERPVSVDCFSPHECTMYFDAHDHIAKRPADGRRGLPAYSVGPAPRRPVDVLGNAQQFRAADTAGSCLLRGGQPLIDEDIGVYIACL